MRIPLPNILYDASQGGSTLGPLNALLQTQQNQAQAKYAMPQQQGAANIALGVGQQELGQGAYAYPQAQANLGLTQQEAQNVGRQTQLMPWQYAPSVINAILSHPKTFALLTHGAKIYGNGVSNLANNFPNLPGMTSGDTINFLKNTYPGSNGNTGGNTGNPFTSTNSSAPSAPAQQPVQPTPAPNTASNNQSPPLSNEEVLEIQDSGMNVGQAKLLMAGEKVIAPNGYGYIRINGKTYKSPTKVQ